MNLYRHTFTFTGNAVNLHTEPIHETKGEAMRVVYFAHLDHETQTKRAKCSTCKTPFQSSDQVVPNENGTVDHYRCMRSDRVETMTDREVEHEDLD